MTLSAGDILDLPATTVITSLPQLTAEGTPLAEARLAEAEARLAAAAAALEAQGEALTTRTLAAAARISLNTACAWLRQRRSDEDPPNGMLSTTLEEPFCTPDNTPTMPTAAPAAGAGGPAPGAA